MTELSGNASVAGEGSDFRRALTSMVAVAAENAADVDHNSRFPQEAIEAARNGSLLGAAVPSEFGGLGLNIAELCHIVEQLGRVCSSTGMVMAMHYIQVLCLSRHGRSEYLQQVLRRCAKEQLLLASATTEVNIGGDSRSSSCAVRALPEGQIELKKTCPVISYGRFADAILVTARRNEDAVASDQVLVYLPADDYQLNKTFDWDALGMRGTCSEGFEFAGITEQAGVLDDLFEKISAETMLPAAHTLWASVWYGMAAKAGENARTVVQRAARKNPENPPPSALRLAELEVSLQSMAELVRSAIARYQAGWQSPEVLESLQFAISMNTLKVASADLVRKIVGDAMLIVGIAGFANRSPLSLARLYRDSIAPSVMVNNDRIYNHTSTLLLVSRGER
ncbi:acyl-CoA dehydrogenase family protein [Psychromicrobium lacuslunae]|uniref:Acyl-CoA dehydrogenase n=1 Tax=Psychromicrobium lacuslunae TaxID=1618207 RepID=A0A0D4C2J0_9MICC|nr:acyl-CoA dehydrogenase family protein [Psychromicrobium lacuslunae]AJT42566.1 acyl-CoA dehydrogenase [Psychromicrobium lacuslunae]